MHRVGDHIGYRRIGVGFLRRSAVLNWRRSFTYLLWGGGGGIKVGYEDETVLNIYKICRIYILFREICYIL